MISEKKLLENKPLYVIYCENVIFQNCGNFDENENYEKNHLPTVYTSKGSKT